MIISCLGDSLTEGDYGLPNVRGVANVHAENYPYFLAKLTGAEVRNFGKCGYTSSRYLAHYREGNADVGGSDIILIMLGTNGGQSPDDRDAPENVAYRTLAETLRADVPEAKIVLCTPPHVTPGTHTEENVARAVAFVKQYASESGLAMIDVAACPDFTVENEPIMQANDGVHFVEAGYRVLAQYMYDGIRTLYPDMFA